jgi:hypothetical protein
MPRKPNLLKRLGNVIREYMLDRLDRDDLVRSSRPSAAVKEMQKWGQQGSLKVEKPTRDRELFRFVMDVEANMPLAAQALTQLSEDVALDENGDDRAWGITVVVEPLDDTDAARKVARELRQTIQQLGDDYADRTEIGYNTKHYVRKMLSTGNCFAEQWPVLDSETGLGEIAWIKELPTWQMHVAWSDKGDLTEYQQWT